MKKNHVRLLLLVVLGFAAGYVLRGGPSARDEAPPGASESDAVTEWTCSMHPQIRQPVFGQCPLCGMDLIPVEQDGGGGDTGPRELFMSAAAHKLARVETAFVERRAVTASIHMVGKIAYDETRQHDVTLLSEGQLRRLFVNYEGVSVRKGDHLAEIYSPEVFSASRELVVAVQSGVSEQVTRAVRHKLLLLGVSPQQIEEMARTGEAADTYIVYSPADGYVIRLEANQGGWVSRGGLLVTLADTSVVWAQLDAYEKDIGFIHYGQQVELQAEAWPGRALTGFVAFIPPGLEEKTRSIKVRLNVPNGEGLLKPGMFVRAGLSVTMNAEGQEIDPGLAKKWICPMHPEIMREANEPCPVCGMELVSGASLGFLGEDGPKGSLPLVIPASAPLITGRRAVVYVADPDREGIYEGREVELGIRAGDEYVVRAGLSEGEQVVVRGALQIDSAIQILAKPSMMSPSRDEAQTGPRPQTHCPIMGGEIDRGAFVDFGGYRIYFCCKGCDEDFLEDPQAHLDRMRAEGIELERTPGEGDAHEHQH